jgi:hypothetical protein
MESATRASGDATGKFFTVRPPFYYYYFDRQVVVVGAVDMWITPKSDHATTTGTPHYHHHLSPHWMWITCG